MAEIYKELVGVICLLPWLRIISQGSETNLFTAAKEERVQITARHSDEMWCSVGFGGEVKTGLNVLFPH